MQKIKDEWYKNKTWNGKADSIFEQNFKYTRGDNNKAFYLQQQGCLLLLNNQKNIQEVGLALLSRLIEDFPAEHSSIVLAQEKMGDYFLHQKKYGEAAKYFTIVVDYCAAQNSSSGTSGLAVLKFAVAIFKTGEIDKMERAYELLQNFSAYQLKMDDARFYYNETGAHICAALHKKEEAVKYAAAALKIVTDTPVTLHKKPGTASPTKQQLHLLQQIWLP